MLSLVPDGRGLENREVSWGAAGLSTSVAGEVGMGIRSPVEESWPLRLWEGGEVGPSLLAEDKWQATLMTVWHRTTSNNHNIVSVTYQNIYSRPQTGKNNENSRVDGLGFLPRLRPPGVDVGEDIADGLSRN